jgi:hypothetical protein
MHYNPGAHSERLRDQDAPDMKVLSHLPAPDPDARFEAVMAEFGTLLRRAVARDRAGGPHPLMARAAK